MKKISKAICNYVWFVKESQKFMKGSENLVVVFLKSLYKGIGFCKNMEKKTEYE